MKYYAYIDHYDTTVRGCPNDEGVNFSEAKKEAIDSMQSQIYELKRQIKHVRSLKKKDITIYNLYE